MSYQNFTKALKLAPQCDGYLVGEAKTNEVILRAEALLNIQFSKQTYEYCSKLGFIEFFGVEIYGIIKDDFTAMSVGSIVEATLQDRKELNLPRKWVTLYFFDDGYYGYLDYGDLNEDGEPPVIMASYNGKEFVKVKKVADDLGDFLLELADAQLATQ